MGPWKGCQTSFPIPYPISPPPVLSPTLRVMPMIWDAPLTAALAQELNARLGGARLRGLSFDWDNRELSLYFRSETLRWSLHPQNGWVTLDPPEEPPGHARLISADLVAVEAPVDERLLRFEFRKVRGRSRIVQVIVELMTNQWNALLVEGSEGWVRHLLWTRRSKGRTLAVGHRYTPPEPSTRRGKNAPLTEEEWERMVAVPGVEGTMVQDPGEELLASVAFTSPVNLPALLEAPGGSAYPIWIHLKSLTPLQPCILETSRGKQPYPIVLQCFRHEATSTLLEAVRACSKEDSGQDGSPSRVLAHLDRGIKRADGRVRGLQREMAQAADPGLFRERANLLLARLGNVSKGSSETTLTGFSGEEVTIQLDPTLSPHENAEALYEEAGRQERAQKRLPPLLKKAVQQLEKLKNLREALVEGEISPEEAQARVPRDRRPKGRTVEGESLRLPYKKFRSSGGLEIRVGKGSRDNDALTFQHAGPEDIWLHARDNAGAHVILRWNGKDQPPAKDLAEAAILAALHSRARNAGVTPVDWTRRKHVRKPRKAPPGTVIPRQTATVFVEPDSELPGRLAWED